MSRALTLKEIGRVRRAHTPLVQAHASKAALARTLGVSSSIVGDVLSGAQYPGEHFAAGVARATGKSLETLLTFPSGPNA
jgi:transcriptional regulator with XRE-family HTH domain